MCISYHLSRTLYHYQISPTHLTEGPAMLLYTQSSTVTRNSTITHRTYEPAALPPAPQSAAPYTEHAMYRDTPDTPPCVRGAAVGCTYYTRTSPRARCHLRGLRVRSRASLHLCRRHCMPASSMVLQTALGRRRAARIHSSYLAQGEDMLRVMIARGGVRVGRRCTNLGPEVHGGCAIEE